MVMQSTKLLESEIKQTPFIRRVDGLPVVFPQIEVIKKSIMGVSRQIEREKQIRFHSVEPEVIAKKKDNIKKLRAIRKQLKELTKTL